MAVRISAGENDKSTSILRSSLTSSLTSNLDIVCCELFWILATADQGWRKKFWVFFPKSFFGVPLSAPYMERKAGATPPNSVFSVGGAG